MNKFKIPMISAGTALAAVRHILTFYNSRNNTGWVVKYDAVADYHSWGTITIKQDLNFQCQTPLRFYLKNIIWKILFEKKLSNKIQVLLPYDKLYLKIFLHLSSVC